MNRLRANDEKILKEYIRRIISEDDFGGFDFTSDYGYGGSFSKYGYGDWSHVKKLFDIFADPVRVAGAEIQKIIPNFKAFIHSVFETVMTTVVPFLSSDYEKIFKRRDERVKEVEQKYGDVYKRMWSSFTGGGAEDLLILGFMMNPGLFMAAPAFWKSSEQAAAGVKFLAGNIVSDTIETISSLAKEFVKVVTHDAPYVARRVKSQMNTFARNFEEVKTVRHGKILYEENDKKEKVKNYVDAVKKFKKSDEYNEILKSRRANEIKTDAEKILGEFLNGVVESAKKRMSSVNSVNDVMSMLGGESKELSSMIEKLDEGEKKEFEKQLVESIRENIKSWYVKKLSDDVKKAKDSGLPSGTRVESMYERAISSLS